MPEVSAVGYGAQPNWRSPSASPGRRINEIVHGKRRITADTALRLTRYFATTDRFGLDLQTRYDLEIEKDHLGTALDQILPLQSD
jgi:plasmid maintenance system antidote protein VapI